MTIYNYLILQMAFESKQKTFSQMQEEEDEKQKCLVNTTHINVPKSKCIATIHP